MKLKRNGKDYDYDYKSIIMKGEYFRALKELSIKEKKPLGKMISILVKHYESSIR
jgi:hypothetical protein